MTLIEQIAEIMQAHIKSKLLHYKGFEYLSLAQKIITDLKLVQLDEGLREKIAIFCRYQSMTGQESYDESRDWPQLKQQYKNSWLKMADQIIELIKQQGEKG